MTFATIITHFPFAVNHPLPFSGIFYMMDFAYSHDSRPLAALSLIFKFYIKKCSKKFK